MKVTISLLGVAAAGLVQVGAAPLRIVWPGEESGEPLAAIQTFRLGRPAAPAASALPFPHVQVIDLPTVAPTLHVSSSWVPASMPAQPNLAGPTEGGRRGCGKLRVFKAKALKISNAFRQAMGLPEIDPSVAVVHHNLPYLKDAPTTARVITIHKVPARPEPVPMHARHHHHPPAHRVRLMDQPFANRLHFALSALGTWEGRAVAFVLGCGIGVLLRMFWVLIVISYRAIRGSSSSDEIEYQHIFEAEYDAEEIVVAPPRYVIDEKVPVLELKEQDEEMKRDDQAK